LYFFLSSAPPCTESETAPVQDNDSPSEEGSSTPGTSIGIGQMIANAVGLNSVSVGATEDEAAGAASGQNMALAAAAVTPGFSFGFAS